MSKCRPNVYVHVVNYVLAVGPSSIYVLTNVVININIIMNIVKKSSDKQTYDAWA